MKRIGFVIGAIIILIVPLLVGCVDSDTPATTLVTPKDAAQDTQIAALTTDIAQLKTAVTSASSGKASQTDLEAIRTRLVAAEAEVAALKAKAAVDWTAEVNSLKSKVTSLEGDVAALKTSPGSNPNVPSTGAVSVAVTNPPVQLYSSTTQQTYTFILDIANGYAGTKFVRIQATLTPSSGTYPEVLQTGTSLRVTFPEVSSKDFSLTAIPDNWTGVPAIANDCTMLTGIAPSAIPIAASGHATAILELKFQNADDSSPGTAIWGYSFSTIVTDYP